MHSENDYYQYCAWKMEILHSKNTVYVLIEAQCASARAWVRVY